MKTKFYKTTKFRRAIKSMVYLGLTMLVSSAANAQFRNYTKVFSDNIKGATTMFGNTLMHIEKSNGSADTTKMNGNRKNGNSSYGNDNENMQYVDIDGNSGAGAKTRNSSSANLTLPAGTNTIKLARLYWGARVKKSDFDITLDTFKRVKIRFGNGSYTEYAAAQLDKNSTGSGSNTVTQYQAYVDITPYIQANGSGTYTVGNVAASTGAAGSGGNYAGWTIVVVYENLDLPVYNSIRVYDGFEQVYDGGSSLISSVTLTGLNVPSGPMNFRDAKMGVMVWEGDANLNKDYVKINNIKFYNGLNAVDNPWNGTITDTGVHVTTKSPNYTNQMGIDIDQFYVGNGYGIRAGDNTVSLEFGTEADQYFPGLFTFQIKTNDPTVTIDKEVRDANGNRVAEANEVLTYTLKGRNVGLGNANLCVITDTLPKSVTYVPGSVKFISCPGFEESKTLTDNSFDDQVDFIEGVNALVLRIGTGADNNNGGVLAPGESFEIQYQVKVNDPGTTGFIPPIINVVRITAFSDAGVKSTDDGTAIVEPLGGPLPVTLKTFLVNLSSANLVKVNWTTTMEINCKNYEIERSLDGKAFTTVGTVNGAGNSSIERSYSFDDNVASVKNNTVYYRLRQIDLDGRSSFSKVVSVRLKAGSAGFTVSPNPFSSYVNINLDWNKNEPVNVKVLNMTGKEVVSKNVQLTKGTNYITVNELNPLPAGMYIIQVNTGEEKIIKQVVKQ